MNPSLLILAGGLGSRYGGLKQIDQLGPNGETLLEYSIYDAYRAGFEQIYFIIKSDFVEQFSQQIVNRLPDYLKTHYINQTLTDLPSKHTHLASNRQKPWGTGHAIWTARNHITNPFLVINADDYYGPHSFKIMYEFLSDPENKPNSYSMVGYQLKNTTSPHGSVNRAVCEIKDNHLQSTLEHTQISHEGDVYICPDPASGQPKTLTGQETVSMNFWGFTPQIFDQLEQHFHQFLNQIESPQTQEFYIPNVVSDLISNKDAEVKVLNSSDQWFGLTYPQDKERAINHLQQLIQQDIYPKNLWS